MTIIGATSSATHILIFPYPAQGHMIPLLDLARNLAARNLTITIFVTPKNLYLLNSLLSDHPSIQTLVLPFPSHPSLPSGVENAKDLPPNSFVATMICALGQLHDPLLHWFQTHPSPPVAIISDMFSGWTHRLARQLSIRNITFSPSGAMALSTIYSLWRDLPLRRNSLDDVFTFSRVPNYPKYPWWQISPVYRSYVEGDPDSEFVKDGFQGDMASWGLVVNSFSELERVYLDHLVKELGHDRVWAVGPLLPPNHDNISAPADRGGSSSISVAEIFSWLDACQDLKVVYVCFGSQVILTNVQMEEIALALEKSGVHFIWSVKNPTKEQPMDGSYGSIPSGFEDRVVGRGLVIKGWAPQVHILSHRAVGSFLTHCGWNSILEGTVAGVSMLAWPMGADQFVNASLIVDDLKVAKRVCEGAHTVPNSTELAQVLAESVAGNRVERERVMELSRAAAKAVKGGSSVKDLDALVKSITGLEL